MTTVALHSSRTFDCKDDEVLVLAKILTPEGVKRTPVDVSVVIDVSGSMANMAAMKDGTGKMEDSGLSILDLTTHAVKTIVKILGPEDRLGIVSFDSNAITDLDLTVMDDAGQKKAIAILEGLRTRDSTNIWDGLVAGLEVLRKSERGGRLASVLLLTDGVPNVHPPNGYLPSLRAYKKKYEELSCIVNTFGFGYNLDSGLLRELATECDGAFAFIPDSGFVGTVFVNAATNLLTTMAKNTTLSLELSDGAQIEKIYGNYSSTTTTWGLQVQLGQLQYGQSRDLLFKIKLPPGKTLESGDFVNASVNFVQADNTPVTVASEGVPTPSIEVEIQRHRLVAVEGIMESLLVGANTKILKHVLAQIDQTKTDDARLADLRTDISGQGIEAVSDAKALQKWGRHYLPSLARTHLLQQCNNFKDPGVQHYGGKLFHELRDIADDIFLAIPPPKPSRAPARSSSSAAPAAKVNMRTYYSSASVCFGGECEVAMADGTTKLVQELRRGDAVKTPTGSAKIRCVVESVLSGITQMVSLEGGLIVTPYHPVRQQGSSAWHFPIDMGKSFDSGLSSVYSFLLEQDHIMLINGYECIGLAHGIVDDKVAAHPFFGTKKVVADLMKMQGWESGHVRLSRNCLVRDSKSGLINKFDTAHEL